MVSIMAELAAGRLPHRLIVGSLSNVWARKGRKIHTSHGQHYRYRARSGVVRPRRCPPVRRRDRGRRGTPHDRVRGLADARRGPRRDPPGGAPRQAFPAQRADRGLGPSRRSGRRRRHRARAAASDSRGRVPRRVGPHPAAGARPAGREPPAALRRTALSPGLRSTCRPRPSRLCTTASCSSRARSSGRTAARDTSGKAQLLQRYSLVAQLAPEVRRGIAAVRANRGLTVEQAVTCGDLPELRSLTMPLIEELDLEVETLDSTEGLRAVGKARAERFAESAPAIRLACAVRWLRSKRRGSATRSVARIAAAIGVICGARVGKLCALARVDWGRADYAAACPRPGQLPPRPAPPQGALRRLPAARRSGPRDRL